MDSKKLKIFVALWVAWLLIFVLLPKGINEVPNAIVNQLNGDIAYVRYNPESSRTILTLVDADANVLFRKELHDSGNGSPLIAFSGEGVFIYLRRSETGYGFSREGVESDEYLLGHKSVEEIPSFCEWKKERGLKYFELNGTKYCYEFAPFPNYIWKNYCKLYIEDENGNRHTLYKDEVNRKIINFTDR